MLGLFVSLGVFLLNLIFVIVGIGQFISTVVFWSGFLAFAFLGAFLFLGEEPIPGHRTRKPHMGFITYGIIMIVLGYGSKAYADLIPLAAAGVIGFIDGVAAKVGYSLLFQSRWAYCS